MPGKGGGTFGFRWGRNSKKREAVRRQDDGYSREEDGGREYEQQQHHRQLPYNGNDNELHSRMSQLERQNALILENQQQILRNQQMLLSASGISSPERPKPIQTRSLSRETGTSFQLRQAQKKRTPLSPRAFTGKWNIWSAYSIGSVIVFTIHSLQKILPSCHKILKVLLAGKFCLRLFRPPQSTSRWSIPWTLFWKGCSSERNKSL